MRITGTMSVLLCVLLSAQAAAQQPISIGQTDPWLYWNLARLQPGRELTVETAQPKRKVKGIFAGRDGEALKLRLKSGAEEAIARKDIAKVTAKRKAYNYGPVIGAAGGAALGAALPASRWDLNRGGLVLICAGLGALAGWLVRAAANDELIYRRR